MPVTPTARPWPPPEDEEEEAAGVAGAEVGGAVGSAPTWASAGVADLSRAAARMDRMMVRIAPSYSPPTPSQRYAAQRADAPRGYAGFEAGFERIAASSPRPWSSRTMSQPPTSFPSTQSCG